MEKIKSKKLNITFKTYIKRMIDYYYYYYYYYQLNERLVTV